MSISIPRWLGAALIAQALTVCPLASAAQEEPPIRKADFMRLVGRPVFDDQLPAGLHVWIHQGKVHFGAVARAEDLARKKKSSYTFRLQHSAALEDVKLGAFKRHRASGKGTILISVQVGREPVQGELSTKGELIISEAKVGAGSGRRTAAVYLGPVNRRAAPTVRIGRY